MGFIGGIGIGIAATFGGSSFFSSGTSGMPNRVFGLLSTAGTAATAAAGSFSLSLSLCLLLLSPWDDDLVSLSLSPQLLGDDRRCPE
jgi:hypothetical protein